MDQFIIAFVVLVGGGGGVGGGKDEGYCFFKESPSLWGFDLIWIKYNMQWYKKILKNQFEVKRNLVKSIKPKNE